MNWSEVAKKNKDKKQKKIVVQEEIKEKVEYNPYSELNFKDVDDEFDYKYLDKMTDISIEFRDFISNNYLPFMDKRININYDIYDLIKDHSYEYEKEMEEIRKEIEEEENLSD